MTSSPRKTKSTATVDFSKAARTAGLHLQGVSLASVHLLAEIKKKPIPMQKRCAGRHDVPSPRGAHSVSIGPLITHGLVVLRDEFYVTTPKGDEYLTKMKGAGLLNAKAQATPTRSAANT